jgi:hypothetical protein
MLVEADIDSVFKKAPAAHEVEREVEAVRHCGLQLMSMLWPLTEAVIGATAEIVAVPVTVLEPTTNPLIRFGTDVRTPQATELLLPVPMTKSETV